MYKVKDKVIVKDYKGNEYKGEIVNINDYREPSMKYAIYIDGFEDYVFVGDNLIVKKID
jgi:hypothetical protein